MAAGVQLVQEQRGDCGHAAGEHHRRLAAFQRGQPVLQQAEGGVAPARVEGRGGIGEVVGREADGVGQAVEAGGGDQRRGDRLTERRGGLAGVQRERGGFQGRLLGRGNERASMRSCGANSSRAAGGGARRASRPRPLPLLPSLPAGI